MNNVHYSQKSDEWETPQDVFDRLNKLFNFDIDVASSEDNTKVKDKYFTIKDDALSINWGSNTTVWCNPPYSTVKLWIKKAYEESILGVTVVMLIPARTDTRAWHDYIFPYAKIEFLRGRLKFSGSKNSAPFPSAVVIFYGKQGELNQAKEMT